MMNSTSFTLAEITASAKENRLGRFSRDDLRSMCTVVGCMMKGSKKEELVKRIHQVLSIPFDEKIFQERGIHRNDQTKRAKSMDDIEVFQDKIECLSKVEGEPLADILQKIRLDKNNVQVTIDQAFEKLQQSFQRLTETVGIEDKLHELDIHMVKAEEVKKKVIECQHKQKAWNKVAAHFTLMYSNQVQSCSICLMQGGEIKLTCLHPCGHLFCVECASKIPEKCAICRAYIQHRTTIFN